MASFFKNFLSSGVMVLASVTMMGAMAQTSATPASPEPSARAHGKGFKALDLNNDKLLSRDEAKGRPHLSKNFDAIDANKDGQLSRDEIRAHRKAHKGEGKNQPKS